MRSLALLLLVFALFAPPSARADKLELPLDCRMGETCFVQNWPDYDPGAGAKDPACRALTYDTHDGLDIRVGADAFRAGVEVKAPGDGIVEGMRDGEPDGAFVAEGAGAVAGKECGNGVRIARADGATVLLCHLRRGSVRVRPGEPVVSGQTVGVVGMSGKSEFPHVHLALLRGREKLDPLTGAPFSTLSCREGGVEATDALWSPAARSALTYVGEGLVDAGFLARAPVADERPELITATPTRRSPSLVFWTAGFGLKAGDVIAIRVRGPDGAIVADGATVQARDQVARWAWTGRMRKAQSWPAGLYRGEATLQRGGKILATRAAQLTIR